MVDQRLAEVLAEQPETNGVIQRTLDFVSALRRAGVPVALAEGIEAVRVLRHLDLLDREMLRHGLAALLVNAQSHRRAFDELFDLYFPARQVGDPLDPDAADPDAARDGEPGDQLGQADGAGFDAGFDPAAFVDDLLQQLGEGSTSRVTQMAREAVERFGRVVQRDGSVQYFQYKVNRALDPGDLLRLLLEQAGAGGGDDGLDQDDGLTPLEERLLRDEFEARVRAFQQEVEVEIRRRAAEDRGLERVADRLVRPPLEETDFFRLSAAEQAEMRTQIRPLARKLATRVAVKRKHGRDGRLDVRRTVRRSMATGGVPFEPSFRPRRPHKPELFVICDVSGSVAQFARFTLMLVHTLQEQFAKVRSYAFVDTLDEVTRIFEQGDFGVAMQRMMAEADLVWFDGHSDYGHSLSIFGERYAKDLSPRSTVLVLGDARNNYRATNDAVLRDVAHRARSTWWLNPEPRQFWDTGDSVASSYARWCDGMLEVRNLKQLTTFVERIAV